MLVNPFFNIFVRADVFRVGARKGDEEPVVAPAAIRTIRAIGNLQAALIGEGLVANDLPVIVVPPGEQGGISVRDARRTSMETKPSCC